MVLIVTAIDEQANELRISFPAESELEGFSVSLRTGLEEMGSWDKYVSPSFRVLGSRQLTIRRRQDRIQRPLR